MQHSTGFLSLTDLAEMVDDQTIDTIIVAFTDLYGRFVGKRYAAPFFVEHVAESGTHACNYLLTVDMEMDPVAGYQFANWQKGYGDFQLVPDLATLRVASWLDKTALVICDVRDEESGELVDIAPRSILKKRIEQATRRDFQVMAGSELEYYLFRNSFEQSAQLDYNDKLLEPTGWYIEDYHILQGTRTEEFHSAVRRHLQSSGIAVECTKGEWGLGQHELNVRYDQVLRMADNHVVYKQCLKEVAEQQEISVTFMSKFAANRAGSSSHVHCSLWRDGTNVFAGDTPCGTVWASADFRRFLAGWISHVPDVMVFYAPNINSYKRFQTGSWAPTRIGWSRDNRTAGFRVVGQDSSLRVECRIPGADCNPYLTYAASIASGLAGIDDQLEPPAMHQGDVYHADELPHVPSTLKDATDRFAASEFARHVFGSNVVDHYVHFFRSEQAAFDRAVTDWERRRYFERI